MTKDEHNGLFGLLIIASLFCAFAGLLWFPVIAIYENFDRVGNSILSLPLPGWLFFGGFGLFIVFVIVGRLTEPRRR